MKSTFGKLLIAAVIAVTAAVVIPATANAATEKKGDYTVSADGQETKIYDKHGTEFLNFDTIKTYANGTTRKEKFKYYLKSANSYHDIPGLGNTNVLGVNCETMVPQGICMMDGLTLISAYDAGNATPSNGDKYVYYYSKKQINGAVYYCKTSGYLSARIDIRSQKKLLDIDAAYCTYYEGRLWFGNFSSDGTSVIYAYNVSYDSHNVPKLVKVGDLEAPRASQ